MPKHDEAMDPYIPDPAVALCETFFFGASLLLDTLPCVTETEDSRSVHGIVCFLDHFHAVSIRTSRLRLPILTRTWMLGAEGRTVAEDILCWSCP